MSSDPFDFYESSGGRGETDALENNGLSQAPGWQSVIRGIKSIELGTGLQVLSPVGLFIVGIIARSLSGFVSVLTQPVGTEGGSESKVVYYLVNGFVVCFFLLGTILRLIGFIRCTRTPQESGARGLALSMLICEILVLVGAILIVTGSQLHFALALLGSVICGASSLTGLIFLLLFLRKLGATLEIKKLSARVPHFVFWLLGGICALPVITGLYFVMLLVVSAGEPSQAKAFLALTGLVLLYLSYAAVLVILLGKYFGTLGLASDELRRWVRQ